MKVSDFNLEKMISFQPEAGKILLGEDRMVLFRQEAFLALRQLLFAQLGDGLARAILAQFGHRCGTGDYKSLNSLFEWDTEQDRIACGPVMHTWEGIVHVEPTFLEFDHEAGNFHMKGIWRNSYEAQNHIDAFGIAEEPVCHTLTGYASGWCTAFFGTELVAIETCCEGKGDDHCEFEVRLPDEWGPEADSWRMALTATDFSISRELEENLTVIQRQQAAIRELSTPILEVWDDVLVLPIVGVVDTRRSMEIMNTLLERIVESQSQCIIIDVTGVEVVDTKTADYLLKVVQAAQLLGARCVLSGINPAVAQTLVEIGADLSTVTTLRNLKAGLLDSIRYLRQDGRSKKES